MERFIYADNAATTKLRENALKGMMPYLKEEYANASSLYNFGAKSKVAIEQAREQVANAIGAKVNEIYFTAGGSEADNWAIKGYAHAMLKKGKNHIISTKFEHHAVLHTLNALEKEGFQCDFRKRAYRYRQ